MTTPYALPPPIVTIVHGFTPEQMQQAFKDGAASRDAEVEALRADAESWRKYKARKDAVIAAGMGRNPLRGPAVYEHLRAAQAHAVMPLIGPLLDAWEGCSQNVRSEHPELDKQLRRINRAMEDSGDIAAEGKT